MDIRNRRSDIDAHNKTTKHKRRALCLQAAQPKPVIHAEASTAIPADDSTSPTEAITDSTVITATVCIDDDNLSQLDVYTLVG
jgi:hypothetical protein